MALYVVAYPRFTAGDADWIEDVRRRYDPQATRLAAHVTLVFHLEGVGASAAVAQLQQVASGQERLDVCFDAVALRAGLTDDDFYAYLLPGQGSEALVALHGALYGGVYGSRPSLPFEPHLTLGRSADYAAMERLVGRLQGEKIAIRAAIDELYLLAVSRDAIEPLGSAGLG